MLPLVRRPSLPAVHGRLGDGAGGAVVGWFIVDSGASMTIVGPEAAPLLVGGAAPPLATVAASGTVHLEPAILPVLELGPLVLHDVPVWLDASQPAPIGPGVVATLGLSLLRRFHVVLDIPGQRLELRPPEGPLVLDREAPGEGLQWVGGELPFEIWADQVIVRARIDDAPERPYVFDTGADSLFVFPPVIEFDTGIRADDPSNPRITSVNLGGRETVNVLVPLPGVFVLGGKPFRGLAAVADPSVVPRAQAMRLDIAGTLGLFTPARWTLDFQTQRLTFDLVAQVAR